jgi:hypothetical protein
LPKKLTGRFPRGELLKEPLFNKMPRNHYNKKLHCANSPSIFSQDIKRKIKIREISGDDPRPCLDVTIFGEKFTGMIDSGSLVTVLGRNSESWVKKWGLKIKPYKNILKNANGDRVGISGTVNLPFEANGKTHVIKNLIAPNLSRELLISTDAFKDY